MRGVVKECHNYSAFVV